jgi:hypothetical protein
VHRGSRNRQLEFTGVCSYDEHKAARVKWFWQVVSAAAIAIGRAGASRQWGANLRRETLLDLGLKAAQAAGIAGPDSRSFERLCESSEWHKLDASLFAPESDIVSVEPSPEMTIARRDQALAVHNVLPPKSRRTVRPRVRRKDNQLEATLQLVKQMRKEGCTHQEICKRLGDHPRPIHAAWKDLSWPIAYLQHTSSVKKWLSTASK